jgi:hypothetical protein
MCDVDSSFTSGLNLLLLALEPLLCGEPREKVCAIARGLGAGPTALQSLQRRVWRVQEVVHLSTFPRSLLRGRAAEWNQRSRSSNSRAIHARAIFATAPCRRGSL